MKGSVNNSKVTVNGREVRGIEKYFWLLVCVALVAFAIGIIAFVGLPLIGIALMIVALAFIPALIYRLIAGKWPSWFQVEYQ